MCGGQCIFSKQDSCFSAIGCRCIIATNLVAVLLFSPALLLYLQFLDPRQPEVKERARMVQSLVTSLLKDVNTLSAAELLTTEPPPETEDGAEVAETAPAPAAAPAALQCVAALVSLFETPLMPVHQKAQKKVR